MTVLLHLSSSLAAVLRIQHRLEHHCSLKAVGTAQNIPAGETEHLFSDGFGGKRYGLHRFADQPADQKHRFFLADVGKKAVVPDLHETIR